MQHSATVFTGSMACQCFQARVYLSVQERVGDVAQSGAVDKEGKGLKGRLILLQLYITCIYMSLGLMNCPSRNIC